jgi:hypothetical protein
VLARGRGPDDDGWGWIYRWFERAAPPGTVLRRTVCGYFTPSRIERAGDGRIYRWLGVPFFGRVIPTGGIAVRRVTNTRMAPYTLSCPSLGAARAFYYRACVFEALHAPFCLTLFALAIQRCLVGLVDFAVQEIVIDLVINVYPMMHHRNTRRRIVALLDRRARAAVE